MPYRIPAAPPSSPPRLDPELWSEPNSYLETRAVNAADTAIVGALVKLAKEWLTETKIKYPSDWHPLHLDLREAVFGRGTYLRVQGRSLEWLRVLVEALRISGEVGVDSGLFDASTADAARMRAIEKEAAIRWVGEEPRIRKVLDQVFSQSSSRLDKTLLSRVGNVPPSEVMRVVYFRSVPQRNPSFYDSFPLAQNLYRALYE